MTESPVGTSQIPASAPGIPTQQVGIPHHPESPLWTATILLVEDDAGDALLVEEMLSDSELDSALTWCKTLGEARTFLRASTAPVCVLLDLHLPDVHGLDAVRQILETDGEAAIVVLTGLEDSGTGLRAVAGGAQDYLVKGRLGPEILSRAIRYALQRKEVERAAAALRANQLMAQENARLERGLLPVPLLRDDLFRARAR
ncbi:response regulator, partial [Streptomyces sp. SID7982]|nr:response regulator [Streptomyces sp. SID7982]